MHAIKKKLGSRRGASLTFALLLFLVCAVVGSVVLVAGTAAAGRLAELGESEQRFYAVNSAAELIVDQLCGKDNKVTVGIQKNADDTFSYILRDATSDTATPAATPANSLALDLAKYVVFGTTSLDEEEYTSPQKQKELFTACQAGTDFYIPKEFSFELTVDGNDTDEETSGEANAIPVVEVTAEFINGYQLNLTVKNKTIDANKQYTLPTIILETDNPRGVNDEDRIEYTFNWRTPKG